MYMRPNPEELFDLLGIDVFCTFSLEIPISLTRQLLRTIQHFLLVKQYADHILSLVKDSLKRVIMNDCAYCSCDTIFECDVD